MARAWRVDGVGAALWHGAVGAWSSVISIASYSETALTPLGSLDHQASGCGWKRASRGCTRTGRLLSAPYLARMARSLRSSSKQPT